MGRVFISYIEEDGGIAEEAVNLFRARRFATWSYERDSIPGPSYLTQVSRAIDQCDVILLLISRGSIRSSQVTNEVVLGGFTPAFTTPPPP